MKQTCTICKTESENVIEIPNGYTTIRVCNKCEKKQKNQIIKELVFCGVLLGIILYLLF